MNKLRLIAVFCAPILIISVAVLFYSAKIFSSQNSIELDYFKGNWTVTSRNDSKQTFNWTVKEDLDKSWLNGVVEQNGNRISTDFWRINNDKIERFAFTSNSIFVKIESSGWEGNKMILKGTLSSKSGEAKVRETITKVSENEFNALWEMEDTNGTWSIFGDEICTK